MKSSFHSFEKVSRWALLSQYFDKPLREKWGYGKLLRKHFCWKLSNIFRFLSQTFVFPESRSLPLHTCLKELRFGKTCICREIKFIIVVKVFSVSCVCFKEIFFRTLRDVHSSNLPRMKNQTSMKIQYSVSII